MAQDLTTGPDASVLIAVGGWLVAIIIAMFTFIANLRRGGAEETAIVLTKWKELVEAHEKQIKVLKDEIAVLRSRVTELEELAETQKQVIEKLEKDLDGERRNAAQQARSFRAQLKRLGHNNEGGVLDEGNSG